MCDMLCLKYPSNLHRACKSEVYGNLILHEIFIFLSGLMLYKE